MFPRLGEIWPRLANAPRGSVDSLKHYRRAARHTTGEFIQFISHAEGSTAELETQVILSIELGFADSKSMKRVFILLDDIRRMLNGLRRKLSGEK
jgi:four helix bundle protein